MTLRPRPDNYRSRNAWSVEVQVVGVICALKTEVEDVCLSFAVSQRVAVHELLAPLGVRAASKERVILEQLHDALQPIRVCGHLPTVTLRAAAPQGQKAVRTTSKYRMNFIHLLGTGQHPRPLRPVMSRNLLHTGRRDSISIGSMRRSRTLRPRPPRA